MWDLPGPGLEPVSPALAGGFLTTAPPGKSWINVLKKKKNPVLWSRNYCHHFTVNKRNLRASLVAQWLIICLPIQGTQVRALVQEDPTCRGVTKPACHNYWACTLEPASHNYWAHVPQLLKPMHLEPMLHNKRRHCNEKPTHHNEEWPSLAATRESPHATTKTQWSQK